MTDESNALLGWESFLWRQHSNSMCGIVRFELLLNHQGADSSLETSINFSPSDTDYRDN